MRRIASTLLPLIMLLAACAGNQAGQDTGSSETAQARIDNRTNYDMDIYLYRQSGSQTRLGFVPASDTAVFALPRALVAGAVTVRFEGRPIRAGMRPTVSEPFTIAPGDVITWSIPPQ